MHKVWSSKRIESIIRTYMPPYAYYLYATGEQMVNHIPNCQLLTNKMGLLSSLQEYERVCAQVKKRTLRLDFLPETYKLGDGRQRAVFIDTFKGESPSATHRLQRAVFIDTIKGESPSATHRLHRHLQRWAVISHTPSSLTPSKVSRRQPHGAYGKFTNPG